MGRRQIAYCWGKTQGSPQGYEEGLRIRNEKPGHL